MFDLHSEPFATQIVREALVSYDSGAYRQVLIDLAARVVWRESDRRYASPQEPP